MSSNVVDDNQQTCAKPSCETTLTTKADTSEQVDSIVARIRAMTGGKPASAVANSVPESGAESEIFLPREPKSFRAAGLNDSMVESLVLKFLLARGDSTGRDVAEQVKLPFMLVDELLRSLKNDQLVAYRSSAAMNDYLYQLTDVGRERGRRYLSDSTYFGAAPVSLEDYIAGVKAQSLSTQQTTAEKLRRAFSDLSLSQKMLDRLGPAVNSGRGLFLYGAPGNGKTSIAERVTKAFGQDIWIPRAVGVDGEIIRLFDPGSHEESPLEASGTIFDRRQIDNRWVRVRRPTIIVGGELTMEALEVARNNSTGICEAPLQMKSNCGILVIDDFGRQKMRTDELLNRWIIPLERRYDFLNLPSGKKIQVPFDQLIIFSTNLEPKDLVDEAFLRRIPYKIEALDPSAEEFKTIIAKMSVKMGFPERLEAIDYLIAKHYTAKQRPFRYCHPRDLLSQVRNYCAYKDCALDLTPELMDMAVENYFAVMGGA